MARLSLAYWHFSFSLYKRRFRHSFHHRNEDSMAVRMDYHRCNCVVHLDVHDVDVDEEKIT